MNVADIVKRFLEENGFDGLYSEDEECGCFKADLFPCSEECVPDCVPGYLVPCENDEGEKVMGIGPKGIEF